jgi:hypothetical protein
VAYLHLVPLVKSTGNERAMIAKKISQLCGNQLIELPQVLAYRMQW